jgi:predicted AlkP superfamily pyrophosphatase or phosphodiesterase
VSPAYLVSTVMASPPALPTVAVMTETFDRAAINDAAWSQSTHPGQKQVDAQWTVRFLHPTTLTHVFVKYVTTLQYGERLSVMDIRDICVRAVAHHSNWEFANRLLWSTSEEGRYYDAGDAMWVVGHILEYRQPVPSEQIMMSAAYVEGMTIYVKKADREACINLAELSSVGNPPQVWEFLPTGEWTEEAFVPSSSSSSS